MCPLLVWWSRVVPALLAPYVTALAVATREAFGDRT